LGTIGATFYLIGIGLLYMMTGTLNLADLSLRVAEITKLDMKVEAGKVTAFRARVNLSFKYSSE
jgi:formate hydrogenlyase subunit 3/multisubunit Na+/H+ antiporter MnhD subunit